jgi:hypothetical protein
MPDREVSAEMTKANYWEVQADMWHQNYKEAADEIERLREALKKIADFDLYGDYSNAYAIPEIAREALKDGE